jgi:hypothetical protein
MLSASCNCCVACWRRVKVPGSRRKMSHSTTLSTEAEKKRGVVHSRDTSSDGFAYWHVPRYENGLHRTLSIRLRWYDLCWITLKTMPETQHGLLNHCSVILEPHRLYRGWSFCLWSLFLAFLDTRSNIAWRRTWGVNSECHGNRMIVFWLVHETPACNITSLELSLLNAILWPTVRSCC